MSESGSKNNSIGFFGLLTILFIGLKLTNYINWSWFWVLSPTIIPILIGLFIVIVLAIGMAIGHE